MNKSVKVNPFEYKRRANVDVNGCWCCYQLVNVSCCSYPSNRVKKCTKKAVLKLLAKQ